jgi:hypothetical protein
MSNLTQIVQDLSVSFSKQRVRGRRRKYTLSSSDVNLIVGKAREFLGNGEFLEALDLYERKRCNKDVFVSICIRSILIFYNLFEESKYEINY